jgi:hypothetical protein
LVLIVVLVSGCAGMIAASVNINVMKGKDVDVVIAELKNKGINCSRKASVQGFSGRMVGAVNCGIRETALFCPESLIISLTFDLATNKVTSGLKEKQTNCF